MTQMPIRKRRTPMIRVLRAAAILIVVLALVYAVLMFMIPAFETVDGTKAAGASDWMKALDDSIPISSVVLPGTHDSASLNARLAFFSKCQAASVGEQLEAGFRYLDIRLALDGDRLKLVHGFVDCRENTAPWSKALYLDKVLGECYSFLEAHPTEFVVFAVKSDRDGDPDRRVCELLDGYIGKDPDRWLLTDSIPTVGQARGRLVLMHRFIETVDGMTSRAIPFRWDNQNNRDMTAVNTSEIDKESYTLWVQDRFKYGTEDKWTAFSRAFGEGRADGEDIFLNFLSTNGNVKFGHPYYHAKTLNARFMESDFELKGWIIVDFASSKIAEKIFSANF